MQINPGMLQNTGKKQQNATEKKPENAERADGQREKKGKNGKSERVALSGVAFLDISAPKKKKFTAPQIPPIRHRHPPGPSAPPPPRETPPPPTLGFLIKIEPPPPPDTSDSPLPSPRAEK